MKKPVLWAAGILVAVVLVVVGGLSIVVKSYLTSDRLKVLIVPRIEDFTGRKADIETIHVSLFKGIVVKGISLKEQDGKSEFVNMKEFVLEYRLLPLLQKKVVIKKVEFVSPSVRVIKGRDGRYNYSDIAERNKLAETAAPGAAQEKGLPMSIETDKISVRDAKIVFTDSGGELPDVSLISDLSLSFSAGGGRTAPEIAGKVTLKELSVKRERAEIKGNGTVTFTRNAADFALTAALGKETVKLSGDVKDYMKKPVARVDLNAAELDLENLMALSEGRKEPVRPQPVRKAAARTREGREAKELGLTASGEVKIGAAKFKGYVLKDFVARYSYSDGKAVITPLSAGLSGGTEVTVQGTAKGDIRFSTAGENPADSVKKTLAGRLTADLTRCDVRETKISSGIAALTGIRELQSPKFDAVHFLFTIGNEKVVLEGTMTSGVASLNPSGAIGFDKRIDVTADLRVAPGIAGKAVSDKFTRYMTDDKGWTVIPLKITGTTDKPSVGLNQAAIGKQVEKGVKQEIEKQLFKGIFGK